MVIIRKILIVCSTEKGVKVISDNLNEIGYSHIDTVKNGGSARRRLVEEDYDLIIIDSPLTDELGSDLAIKIVEDSLSGVIVTTKAENADLLTEKLDPYGVFILSKPFLKVLFFQLVRLVFTSLNRLNSIKKEQDKLQGKVDDIRIVNRAKCLLIQYAQMSEEKAHKYLEKTAMDERLSRREVAEKIIKYYEV